MKTEADPGMHLRAKEPEDPPPPLPEGGAGAGRADSDPEPSARAGPADTLISEFSRTVEEYMCLVLSHQVDGNLLQQPWEGHTDFTLWMNRAKEWTDSSWAPVAAQGHHGGWGVGSDSSHPLCLGGGPDRGGVGVRSC